jgi:hypothetical protein
MRRWCPNPKLPSGVDVRHILGNAVTLLCSKEAGFITGPPIAVDGGASPMDPAV